jgi:hypothetical protein
VHSPVHRSFFNLFEDCSMVPSKLCMHIGYSGFHGLKLQLLSHGNLTVLYRKKSARTLNLSFCVRAHLDHPKASFLFILSSPSQGIDERARAVE